MTLSLPDISKNLFDLNGYCSIVTGAGKGIGLTLSQALAYHGSDLVLVGRSAGDLEAAADSIRAIGRKASTVVTDVTAEEAPEMIVNAAMDMSRRIDVLINNAGFMTFADMLGVDEKTWDEI
jgi:short-subunit dehydrogenase